MCCSCEEPAVIEMPCGFFHIKIKGRKNVFDKENTKSWFYFQKMKLMKNEKYLQLNISWKVLHAVRETTTGFYVEV